MNKALVVKNKQLTDRAIYVYLPTVEMAQEWKALADKANASISKFVIEHVENSLKQEVDRKGYPSVLSQIRAWRWASCCSIQDL